MIRNAWYNCLFTLLNSLSWKGDKKILEDYINGYDDVETASDFKNLMASLGFITRSTRITFSGLNKELFPCLFITKENKPYCILNYSDDVFLAYDGTDQQFFSLNSDTRKGTILTFTAMDKNGSSIYSSRPDWLNSFMPRFKKYFFFIILLSFFLGMLSIFYPFLILVLYRQMSVFQNTAALIKIFSGVLIFIAADSGLMYFRSIVLGYIGQRMNRVIGLEVFRRLLSLQLSYTESASIESQIRRIRDLQNLGNYITGRSFSTLLDLVFVIFMIFWLFFKVGMIAMIPVGGLAIFLVALFLTYPSVKRQQGMSSSAQADRMDLASTLLDGFLDIQTAGMMKPWSKKFDSVSRKAAQAVLEESHLASLIASISSFCVSIFNLFTINAMVYMVLQRNIETAVLIPSLMIVRRILGILRSSFIVLSQTDSVLSSIRQLQRFMAIPQEIRPIKFSIAARILPGNIIFNDVSFRYGNEGAPALYMSNFTLETGKIHVFTGMPGSGRTTAVKLIMALYKPQSGRIILGRYNIHQMDVQQFRQKIMFSPAEPVLFYETIEKYITGNSIHNTERMLKIAQETGLYSEMQQHGLDFSSEITDEVLSNNDLAQLISITRVLTHDAFIYILDDPFFVNEDMYIPKLVSVIQEIARTGAIIIIVSNSPMFITQADKRIHFVLGRTSVEVKKEKQQ